MVAESPEIEEPVVRRKEGKGFEVPREDIPLKTNIRLEDLVRLNELTPHGLRGAPVTSKEIDLSSQALYVKVKHPEPLKHFGHCSEHSAYTLVHPQSTK